ncbi:MAG: hypothetical protein PUG67_09320 [Peptoniphilaceae bacterium]|nr:hypothetical protein [Peptoniphilaceae bacterium]MDY6019527.1 hypothetical protein [Anaerococcus sp.]
MENKKNRRIRKRSEVFEMLDGRKLDDACIRFTAKPEKERMRDKVLGVSIVAMLMLLAIGGPNETIKTSGVVMMFLASLMAFLA